MNLSGDSVGPLANYYKVPKSNVVVVYDEIDLPFGTLRLRSQGGSGGHNGMKSLIQHLGNDFPRLRLGVGRPSGRMPPSAYVLQDFGKDEQPVLLELLDSAIETIETILVDGVDLAMTRHNGVIGQE
jgi:PTH1 family peptidyl-tRNA hydrolase